MRPAQTPSQTGWNRLVDGEGGHLARWQSVKQKGLPIDFNELNQIAKLFEIDPNRLDLALNGDTTSLDLFSDPNAHPIWQAQGKARASKLATMNIQARRYDGVQPPTFDFDEQLVFGPEPAYCVAESAWREAALQAGSQKLEDARRSRTNDTCIIVANGPSLNLTNFDLLKRADVFLANYAFWTPQLREAATYLTIVNPFVAEQDIERVNLVDVPFKIIPYWLGHCVRSECGAVMVNAIGGPPRFYRDSLQGISWASTVSFFQMQLAFWLGYKRALLVGFDHSYVQPEAATEGVILEEKADDPNHFDPSYFKGKKWQAADVEQMAQGYRLAKAVWELDGRQIINCTEGGALEVFARQNLADALDGRGMARAPSVQRPKNASWKCAYLMYAQIEGDFGNAACCIEGLRVGDVKWARFVFKLHIAHGHATLEIRQEDCWPYGFASWHQAGQGPDMRGGFDVPLELDLGVLSLREFAQSLDASDQVSCGGVFAALATIVPRLLDAGDPSLHPWNRQRDKIAKSLDQLASLMW